VIASQGGGAGELFVDGREALTHPSGNAAALAQQIMRLACDADLRQRLGKAGRAAAERVYHRKRLAKELLELYGTLTPAGASQHGTVTRRGLLDTPLRPAPTPPSCKRSEAERVGQTDEAHG
jgi:hypothetical protein